MNPIAIIFSVGLGVVMAGTLAVSISNGQHPRGIQNGVDTLTTMVEEAHSTAKTQNGATIVVAPDAMTGRTQVKLYAGRPGESNYGSDVRNDIGLDATLTFAGVTSFAILVAPNGSVGALAYTYGASVTTQPACSSTVDVGVSIGSNSQTWSVPCGEARVEY